MQCLRLTLWRRQIVLVLLILLLLCEPVWYFFAWLISCVDRSLKFILFFPLAFKILHWQYVLFTGIVFLLKNYILCSAGKCFTGYLFSGEEWLLVTVVLNVMLTLYELIGTVSWTSFLQRWMVNCWESSGVKICSSKLQQKMKLL